MESFINTFSGGDYFLAAVIAGVVVVIAIALEVTIKLVKRIWRPDAPDAVPTAKYVILNAIDGPSILIVLLVGLTESLALAAETVQIEQGWNIDTALLVRRIGGVLAVGVAAFTASRLSSILLDWYSQHIAPTTSSPLDNQIIPSVKRMMPIIIYSIAGLWALSIFEIAISPLLATLGIGGIAVALAAQPTLSNYFAGTYVISEGEIKEGDFIEIEGGPSGFVEDISWRSTKLRSRFNNLIIIPNSMMSENMITNYSRPAQAMNVIVTGGVSYSSDLQQVEEILMETARKVVIDSEHAITETDPVCGFSVFGDSNIDFWVFLQATDRAGSFQLKSQLIKEIHARFNQEGIVINYPIRHLVADEPEDESTADTSERSMLQKIVSLVNERKE